MKRFVVWGLFILTVFVSPNLSNMQANDRSPSTHYYFTEFKRPVSGSGNTATLFVVFYAKIDARRIEGFLRTELERSLRLFPFKGSIIAKAYYATDVDSIEKPIKFSDGSDLLIYDHQKGKILTSIQLWGTNFPIPKSK